MQKHHISIQKAAMASKVIELHMKVWRHVQSEKSSSRKKDLSNID